MAAAAVQQIVRRCSIDKASGCMVLRALAAVLKPANAHHIVWQTVSARLCNTLHHAISSLEPAGQLDERVLSDSKFADYI
jgi:hypothetical protein